MPKKTYKSLWRVFLVYLLIAVIVQGPPLSIALAQSDAPIVADGRTQTSVNVNGSVTNIHTNTVNGRNAYNSFHRFNVAEGTTANLHLPGSTSNLINLVHGERSDIYGTVNSFKNGQIGGNVYFLNPHGVLVGQSGVFNVGSLHMLTANPDYVGKLVDEYGQISVVHEQQLFEGRVPLSETGVITVKGRVNAVDTIALTANNINIESSASLRAGRQLHIPFGDVVNVENVRTGNTVEISPDAPKGTFRIVAAQDVNISGQIAVDGIEGASAGDIDIRAGNDIHVNEGAEITARGVGENSDGGNVLIFADRNSYLKAGTLIDVSAENGKGGFLEFSAIDTVNIVGSGLRSSSGGTILIDPKDLIWVGNANDKQFFSAHGTNIVMEATNSILLKDVIISSRQITEANQNDWNSHLDKNEESSGDSGKITLDAPNIVLTDSYILSFATGVHSAGDVEINAQTLNMVNSVIQAHAADGNKAGNVTIMLEDFRAVLEWGAFDLNNPIAAKAEFRMDETSAISGGNIKVDVTAESKMLLDFNDFSFLDDQTNAFVDKFADIINGIIDGKNPLHVKFSEARIEIDGNITATENIDINATAHASAEFKNKGKGLALSAAVVKADSQILIGKNLVTVQAIDISAEGNITMNSTARTTVGIRGKEEGKAKSPFDIVFSLGYAESINVIDIAACVNITAGKDISIKALTERSHSISVEGGDGRSYMGLVTGVLIGDAQTDIVVNGALKAGEDIDISAKTDTEENSVSAVAEMLGDGEDSDWEKAIKIATEPGEEIANAVKKIFTKKIKSDELFDQFGAAGAVSLIQDSVVTNVAVGGKLTAGTDVTVSAETINKITASAFSLIGEYEAGEQEIQKDLAMAVSTPIVLMDNTTKVEIEPNAKISAGQNITITADTKIPFAYNDHPIYKLFNEAFVEDNTDNASDNLKEFLSSLSSEKGQYFGLLDGFLNTWGQSSAQTDKFGGAAMVTYLDINNTTTAQIAGGTINASNLNVNATTTVELANLVGSLAAIKGNGNVPVDSLPDILGINQKHGAGTFDAVYEAGDKGGAAGGAVLWTNIDSTTIARIGSGEVNVLGDIDVKAETKSVDIGIAIGAGRSGTFGLDLMANLSFYDSYTLAKIDDAVKVIIAKNVSITADDTAYRVGIAGALTNSSGVSIGLSGTSSVMLRDAHAVWGNLLNADGSFATIKGERDSEEDVADVDISTITGKVTVKSNLHGLNMIVSAAGVNTSDSQLEQAKDVKRKEYLWAIYSPDSPSYNKGRTQHLPGVQDRVEEVENQLDRSQFGLSGAVVVSYLAENSTAGISGNVRISAGDIKVEALNSIFDVAIGGAGVLQTGSGKNTGIAGGVAVNILDGNTVAYIQPKTKTIDNQTLVTYETLNIGAKRSGNIISVATGASDTTSSQGIQVGGNATVNILEDDTFVRIENANLKKRDDTVGDITATATNSAGIYSLGGGLAIGGNTSIGASAAYNYLGLNTHVNIINSVIDARNLTLLSGNQSSIVTIALGGGVGDGTAIGGTIAVVISNSTTGTGIYGSDITLTGNMKADAMSQAGLGAKSFYDDLIDTLQDTERKQSVDNEADDVSDSSSYLSDAGFNIDSRDNNDKKTASDENVQFGLAGRSPKIVTAALSLGIGGEAGVGANIGVNILTDTQKVNIIGSTITGGTDYTIASENNGGVIATSIGFGGGGKAGVGANLAVNLVGGSTNIILDSATFSGTGEFKADAKNTAGIINASLTVGIGKTAGVGASVNYNQVNHETRIITQNTGDSYTSATTITGSAVEMSALNSADIISGLITFGGGSTAGVGVSIAINTIGEINGKDGEEYNSSERENAILADLQSQFDGTTIAEAMKSSNRTGIDILDGGTITATGGQLKLAADSTGGIFAVAVSLGFAGTAGVGAAGTYNNIGGSTGINISGATLYANNGGVNAGTTSSNRIIGTTVSAAGGTVGVAAGVAVNKLTAKNTIRFADTSTTAANNISLIAANSGDILAITGGVAGGNVAVGAAIGVNILNGKTVAEIIGGTTQADGGSVDIGADNHSKLVSIAAGGGFGGGVSVSAIIAVNTVKGETSARIGNDIENQTIINAKQGISLVAEYDGGITAIGGSVSIGAVGVGGAVAVNTVNANTQTFVENADLTANFNGGNGNFFDLANTKNVIKNVTVNSSVSEALSVNGTVSTNSIGGITAVNIGNLKDVSISGANIYVNATNDSTLFGVVATPSISGAVGVGAAADTELLDQTVTTAIKNAKLTADNNIEIDAIDKKSVETHQVGVGLGGYAGVQGAISIVLAKGTTTTDIVNSVMNAGNNIDINALTTTTLSQTILTAAISGIAGVGITVGVNDITQKAVVNVNKNNAEKSLTSTAGNITIGADSIYKTVSQEVLSYGGAGIAGVGGSVVVTTLADTAETNVGGKMNVNGNNNKVNIFAKDCFKIEETKIGGIGVGVVGGGAGISVLVIKNSALVNSTANITNTNGSVVFDASTIRDIETTTFAAGAGVVGLAAAVNVINAGGIVDKEATDAYKSSISKASDFAKEKGYDNLNTNNLNTVTSPQTASVSISGIVSANNITGTGTVNNKISQNVDGTGGGMVGAGAAIAVMNVSDNISVTVRDGAKLDGNITLSSLTTQEEIYQNVVAGAGGLGALGAAVGVVNVTGNATTQIGSAATLQGNAINLNAGMNVKNASLKVNSVAAGGLGISAAHGEMNFYGDTIVKVASGTDNENKTQLMSNNISIKAEDTFGDKDKDTDEIIGELKNVVVGAGGGAIAGGGAGSYLDITRNTGVTIGDNVFMGVTERPRGDEKIDIDAFSTVISLINQSAVDMRGVAVLGVNIAKSNLRLDTDITVGTGDSPVSDKSKFVTGELTLSSSEAVEKAVVNAMVEVRGGVGIPSTNAYLNVTANNTINVNNTIIDAWGAGDSLSNRGAVNFIVGDKKHVELDAVAYLNNYTAIPVFSAPPANVTFTKNDIVNFTGADISSVSDIVVEAGKGSYDAVGKSEAMDTYKKLAQELLNFFGADVDFALYGGTRTINVSDAINFNGNNTLVAGSHAHQQVTINDDFSIQINGPGVEDDWFEVAESKPGEMKNVYDLFDQQIKALEKKLAEQEKQADRDRYAADIEALRNQLKFYAIDQDPEKLTDENNYGKVRMITIADDIYASSGDIKLNAATIVSTGTGNKLTANYDPSITIENNSMAYLTLEGSILEIPDRVGGRVMQNGKIIGASDISNGYGIDKFEAVSFLKSFAPNIIISNTNDSFAPDLWLKNAMISNPGGSVEILSEGSIWAIETAINARDVSIATGASFYQSYGDGRYDTGGNPFTGAVGDAIYQWIAENTLFGAISGDELVNIQANALAAMNKLMEEFPELELNGDKTKLDEIVDAANLAIEIAVNIEEKLITLQDASKEKDTAQLAQTVAGKLVSDRTGERTKALDELKASASTDSLKTFNSTGNIEDLKAASGKETEFATKKGNYNEKNRLLAEANDDLSMKNGILVEKQQSLTAAESEYKTAASTGTLPTDFEAALKACEIAIDAADDRYTELLALQGQVDAAYEYFESIGQDGAVLAALKMYSQAVTNLQSVCTSESWEKVFGDGGTHEIADLRQKANPALGVASKQPDGSYDVPQYISYADAKSGYLSVLESAAENYLKTKAKQYDSPREYTESTYMANSKKSDHPDVLSISGVDKISTIYGARSVYISAETLNINGTIKSGKVNFGEINLDKIDINDAEVQMAIQKGESLSKWVFGEFGVPNVDVDKTLDNYVNADKKLEDLVGKPTITYEVSTNTFIIDNIVAMGGDITLYGNIISTGNGIIEVADGFGNVTISGTGDYNIELGKVDMGGKDGLKGFIRLIDLGQMGEDTNGKDVPLTTIYTRDANGVYITQEFGNRVLDALQGVTTDGYSPTANRWLQNIIDTEVTLAWTYEHHEGTYYGSGSKKEKKQFEDFGNIQPVEALVGEYKPVGTFLVSDKDFSGTYEERVRTGTIFGFIPMYEDVTTTYDNNSDLLLGEFTRTACAPKSRVEIVTPTTQTSKAGKEFLWWGKKGDDMWMTEYKATQRVTETFTTYLNASQEIKISFDGDWTTPSSIAINGANNITLNDLIRTSKDIAITSTNGDIIAKSDNAVINAQNVTLNANNIGTAGNALRLEAMPGQGIGLAANATGTININVEKGSALINGITGHDVTLRSDGDILQTTASTGIVAHNLNLTASGDIGYQNGGKMDLSVKNNVAMHAIGNIDANFTGDLHAESIVSTAGDVNLAVTGNILDANPNEVPDPLSDAEKKILWDDLGDEEQKRRNDIWNEEGQVNAGALLWQKLTAAQKEQLGWTGTSDEEIAAINEQWAAMPDPEKIKLWKDSLWQDLSDDAKMKLYFGKDLTPSELKEEWAKLSDEVRETRLSDAEVAAIWVALSDEDKKTAWKNDAGWDFVFSENKLAGSIFFSDAGTRSNTTSMIEDPNISGRNVTLEVGGAIGNNQSLVSDPKNSPITIDIKDNLGFILTELELNALSNEVKANLTMTNLPEDVLSTLSKERRNEYEETQAKRRALADAEWDDIEFTKDNDGNIQSIKIYRFDNVNLEASETLRLQTGTGWINVGSQGDIEIDNSIPDNGVMSGIISGSNGDQALRLKTDGSIFSVNPGYVAIQAKNAVLEAAGGTLGSSANSPLIINLTGGNANDGWITARGSEGVYLSFVDAAGKDADVYIREIGSTQGTVDITAKSMYDALRDVDGFEKTAKIGGKHINLTATGGIGEIDIDGNNRVVIPLLIAQAVGGCVSLNAAENIYVYGTKSLDIVKLSSGGHIIDIGTAGDLSVLVGLDWNAKGGSLSLAAEDSVFLHDSITIENGSIFLTAKTGSINLGGLLDVASETVFMRADTGINAIQTNGRPHDVRIIAGILDLLTKEGDLVIDVQSPDVQLKNVVTEDGSIDLYAAGTVFVQNLLAGNDILVGSVGDIQFASYAEVEAGNDLTMISAGGNVLSDAINENDVVPIIKTGGIATLVAQNGRIGGRYNDSNGKPLPFITDWSAPITNLIGYSVVDFLNTNTKPFMLDLLATRGTVQVATTSGIPINIDFLVGNMADASNLYINTFADNVEIDLSDNEWFFASSNNALNQKLLDALLNIHVTGQIYIYSHQEFSNKKDGGTLEFTDIYLSPDANILFEVDNLKIGALIGEGDVIFTHYGAYKGIADSTVIGNIITPGSTIIEKLYSNDVKVFSDDIGGVLKIVDGKVGKNLPGQVDLDVNGIHTIVDSVQNARSLDYDFRFWTLDGNYSLESSHQKASFPKNSSMRLLMEYGVFLPQRNDTSHFFANSSQTKEQERERLYAWLSWNGDNGTSAFESFDLLANRLPVNWGGLFITPLPEKDDDEELLDSE